MNFMLFDLYADYLLSLCTMATATNMAALFNDHISHDQISRMLNSRRLQPKDWWLMVKKSVRAVQKDEGVLVIDDSIIEKPYTEENELVGWHYDHSKGSTVKGINFITTLYVVDEVSLPVSYRLVSKTESYIDKEGKAKRRSSVSKNEHYRDMLAACVHNGIPFQYVINDVWFASAQNMCYIKRELDKDFIMALKRNRKVALSLQDKQQGRYQRVDELDLPLNTPIRIYLEGVPFPLLLLPQPCTNVGNETRMFYLVSSDLSLTAVQITSLYQKRWKVEEYHRSLKQNASVSKSPTRRARTQTNHFVASLWAYTKLEMLKVRTKKNHYALKTHIHLAALREAFHALSRLDPVRLEALSA